MKNKCLESNEPTNVPTVTLSNAGAVFPSEYANLEWNQQMVEKCAVLVQGRYYDFRGTGYY